MGHFAAAAVATAAPSDVFRERQDGRLLGADAIHQPLREQNVPRAFLNAAKEGPELSWREVPGGMEGLECLYKGLFPVGV